jgi:hypothetical protein
VIARWPRVCSVLLAGLLTVLFCLPGLPVALRQIPSYRNPNLTVPTVGAYVAELARVYGLGEHLDATFGRPLQWLLAAWLAVGWLLAVVKGRIGESANWRINESANQRINESAKRHPPSAIRHSLFAICWAALPVVIYYLVIRDRATFASRYISFALPGWLMLGGLALRGWAQARRWSGGLAALLLVAVLAPGLVGDLTDSRFFREDTRGLVAWLKSQATPDDPSAMLRAGPSTGSELVLNAVKEQALNAVKSLPLHCIQSLP